MAGDTEPAEQAAQGEQAVQAQQPAQAEPPPPSSFTPPQVLREALERGVTSAAADRMAEPLRLVLSRALGEVRDGALSDPTRRLLQTALSAANHNEQLSAAIRTALATVAVALRGLP